MEWKGIKGTVLRDVAMKRYTSMKVGGPVKYLFYPLDENDLAMILRTLKSEGIPCRFLGNGTNIIVADKGLSEALIRITRIRGLRYRKTGAGATAEVTGGTSLKRFIRENGNRGLSGLENLFWIPGTVGGALKMNAGSFGSSITDALEGMRILDKGGKVREYRTKDLSFDYRYSAIQASQCVLSASFSLKERAKREIEADMDYVYGERKKRHPMEFPSSGSIFKSVGTEPAWQFVEKAGLRGLRIGGACVSEKHTNFIVNLGGATAGDIRQLIERIKKEVLEKCGVSLEEEVELWGFEE